MLKSAFIVTAVNSTVLKPFYFSRRIDIIHMRIMPPSIELNVELWLAKILTELPKFIFDSISVSKEFLSPNHVGKNDSLLNFERKSRTRKKTAKV
jgi:hypothetical protein